jgi:hypothetical protein
VGQVHLTGLTQAFRNQDLSGSLKSTVNARPNGEPYRSSRFGKNAHVIGEQIATASIGRKLDVAAIAAAVKLAMEIGLLS